MRKCIEYFACTEKTHMSVEERKEVYLIIENLIYLLTKLKWNLTKVHEHCIYLQSEWIKSYVIKKQISRQKSKNNVESGRFKNLNNNLYGSLIVNTNKSDVKAIVDGVEELEKFHENISSDMNRNPFATNETILNYANKKYKEEIITVRNPLEKEILEEELSYSKQKAMFLQEKQKRHKTGKKSMAVMNASKARSSVIVYNSEYNKKIGNILGSSNITSINHLDNTYSIKTIVGGKKQNIKVNTRYVGGAILMHAKLSIASFIHDIMELFMEKTMLDSTREEMKKLSIDKIICSLAVTDTDSCSFQFNGFADYNTVCNEDEFLRFIKNTIYRNLNHRIDTSSNYYAKYNLQDVSCKKEWVCLL